MPTPFFFLLDLSLLDAHLEEDLRTKVVVVVKAIQEVFCKEVHSLKSHADKSYDIPLILGLPPNNVEVSLSRVKKRHSIPFEDPELVITD